LDDELPVLFSILYVRSPGGILGRLDLLPSLTAQDADEAAYPVLLPTCGLDDLGQRCSFGALHHLDHLGFLVWGRLSGLPAGFFGAARLLGALGFLGACLLLSIELRSIGFLLDRVAVVTWIISGREKEQAKSGGDYARKAKVDYG
jgi:hypothetical protein